MKKSLFACSVLFAMNAAEIQNEIKLAKVGEWKGHQYGTFKLELKDLEEIKKNFDNVEVDAVIDLDHATLSYGTGEAQGWIKELEIKEEELWAKVEWLEHGLELLKSGKYKYISPVLQENTIDPVTGNNIGWTLHSAAITNRPFIEDLGEVIANNKSNNEGDEDVKKTDEELEAENQKLKDENQKLKDGKIKEQVTAAIAANKIRPEQKEALIAMGKTNPEEFENFLKNAQPIVSQPENNIFANNNNGGQPNSNPAYDVIKLGGFE